MTLQTPAEPTSNIRRAAVLSVPILYTLALLVATHWPSTDTPSTFTVSDKFVHFSAYCLWTLLIFMCATKQFSIRIVGVVLLLGVLLGALDELTQPLPGIHRSADFYDFVADVIGIVVAIGLWTIWIRLCRRTPANDVSASAISPDPS